MGKNSKRNTKAGNDEIAGRLLVLLQLRNMDFLTADLDLDLEWMGLK